MDFKILSLVAVLFTGTGYQLNQLIHLQPDVDNIQSATQVPHPIHPNSNRPADTTYQSWNHFPR